MLKAPWRVYGECAHEHAAGKADFFEHGRLSMVLKAPSMAARRAAVTRQGFFTKPQSD